MPILIGVPAGAEAEPEEPPAGGLELAALEVPLLLLHAASATDATAAPTSAPYHRGHVLVPDGRPRKAALMADPLDAEGRLSLDSSAA
jgi:hypothetical protein